MRTHIVSWVLLMLLTPAVVFGTPQKVIKGPIVTLPVMGYNDPIVNAPVVPPPYPTPQMDEVTVLGDTVTIGTTWYENQHNGTIGRMVVKDELGYLHFVWMNGLNNGASQRHVYYNAIFPDGSQLYPQSGYAVESATRGGYTCEAVGWGGIAFPAFHQTTTTDNAHSAVATDYFPHTAAFLTFELPYFQGQEINQFIWPRIGMKQDGQMVVVSTEYQATAGTPQRQSWSMGTYNPTLYQITYTDQVEFEYTMTIAADVAASRVSNRVAIAWTTSRDEGFPGGDPTQYNNDIHMLIDDDGVDLNFNDWFNLTNFIYPELSLLPDTTLADGDTIRAYTDLNVFFDNNDYCHVAFTTPGYYELEGLISIAPSLIWHWSEESPNEFSLVANHWYANYAPGAWNRNCQRPSLGQDPTTGYLYCMYQVYDSSSVSSGGYPSGEVYISVSTDGGGSWSRGTNVTNTISPDNAPPGQCLSELTPSMAEVVDGYCHITYVLDRDAGFVVQTEGTWTLNEVKYHKVPVNLIPTTPLIQQIPFHVEHLPDTTGVKWNHPVTPSEFALDQNAPNPFNPTTTIRFSLETLGEIRLAVFNLKGEKVATIAEGVFSAGSHIVGFDGRALASGMYLYRLEAAGKTLQKKMLLLK
mgnify:CR=1 FL=1